MSRGKTSHGILTIVQFVKHPITGEELINEDIIIGGLKGLKGVKKSCYIYHDSDTYKQSDIEKQKEILKEYYIDNQNEFVNGDGTVSISMDDYVKKEMTTTYSYIVVGEKKPPHYHIVIFPQYKLELQTIANVFGVPNHFVCINRQRKDGTTWYECVKYLTHNTTNAIKENKFPYPSDNVVCFGFSYEEEMQEYERMMETYGKALTPEEEIFLQISNGEKTPEDIRNEDRLFYIKYMDKLKKIHNDYLSSLPLPPFRLNIYVEGNGGDGKGLFTSYLARNLSATGKYFKVGGKNVTFEGYKGEDVIIWDDFRGSELMKVFDNQEGKVMDYLDPFPKEDSDQKEHVKFDYINLVNRVNIFESVQPYEEFLLDLVSGNRQKGVLSQSYRRLPVIIRIHQEDYDILMNSGFLNNTNEWLQYEQYTHIRGRFNQIANACKRNLALRDEMMKLAMDPVYDQIDALTGKMEKQEYSDEEIREMFKDVGTFNLEAIQKENENHLSTIEIQELEKEREEKEMQEREEQEKIRKIKDELREEIRKELWEKKHPNDPLGYAFSIDPDDF